MLLLQILVTLLPAAFAASSPPLCQNGPATYNGRSCTRSCGYEFTGTLSYKSTVQSCYSDCARSCASDYRCTGAKWSKSTKKCYYIDSRYAGWKYTGKADGVKCDKPKAATTKCTTTSKGQTTLSTATSPATTRSTTRSTTNSASTSTSTSRSTSTSATSTTSRSATSSSTATSSTTTSSAAISSTTTRSTTSTSMSTSTSTTVSSTTTSRVTTSSSTTFSSTTSSSTTSSSTTSSSTTSSSTTSSSTTTTRFVIPAPTCLPPDNRKPDWQTADGTTYQVQCNRAYNWDEGNFIDLVEDVADFSACTQLCSQAKSPGCIAANWFEVQSGEIPAKTCVLMDSVLTITTALDDYRALGAIAILQKSPQAACLAGPISVSNGITYTVSCDGLLKSDEDTTLRSVSNVVDVEACAEACEQEGGACVGSNYLLVPIRRNGVGFAPKTCLLLSSVEYDPQSFAAQGVGHYMLRNEP